MHISTPLWNTWIQTTTTATVWIYHARARIARGVTSHSRFSFADNMTGQQEIRTGPHLTSSAYFRSLSARAWTSTAAFSVAACGATRCDVHSELGWRGNPIERVSCWDNDVHVAKTDVATDCGTCLPAHYCESAFWTNCSRPQPSGPGASSWWRRCTSRAAPHSQWASTICSGKRILSRRTPVREAAKPRPNNKCVERSASLLGLGNSKLVATPLVTNDMNGFISLSLSVRNETWEMI